MPASLLPYLQPVFHWFFYLLINVELVVLVLVLLISGLLLAKRYRAARGFGIFAAIYVLVIFVSPLVPRYTSHLEYMFFDPRNNGFISGNLDEVEGFILLGGAFNRPAMVKDGPIIHNRAAGRITDFLAVIQGYPKAKIILTGGGKPAPGIESEAELTKKLLLASGVEEARIFIENKSFSTEENAKFTAALIDEIRKEAPTKYLGHIQASDQGGDQASVKESDQENAINQAHFKSSSAQEEIIESPIKKITDVQDQGSPNKPWALVTSAIHMRRAKVWFDYYKLHILPVPVDFHLSEQAQYVVYNTLLLGARTVSEWRAAMYETAGYWQLKLQLWARKSLEN